MAATDGRAASLSLEAARHGKGPLLEFLMAPKASSLMFVEVVQHVLAENRHEVEESLDNLQQCQAHLIRELEALSQTH